MEIKSVREAVVMKLRVVIRFTARITERKKLEFIANYMVRFSY